MGRHKNKEAATRLNTCIPQSLREILDDYLRDKETGKIPVGAYQMFILARIRHFFRIT